MMIQLEWRTGGVGAESELVEVKLVIERREK